MLLRSDMVRSLRPSRALITALLATLLLGMGLTLGTMRLENRAEAIRIDRLGDLVAGNLRQRMIQHMTLLRATASILTAKRGQINPDEFAAYVAGLDIGKGVAGIQGIGFAPLIATADTPKMAEQLSRLHGRRLDILPATDQPMRVPIALLEPRDARNQVAFGFDMFSEPVRRAAILSALDSNEPRATGPVELVQEITADKQMGFLIYLHAPTGLEGMDGSGEGFVYAPFRAGDLFHAVLAETPDLPLTVRGVDLDAPARPLFDSAPSPPPAALAARAVTHQIEVAGRHWQLTMTPTAGFGGLRVRLATLAVGLLSMLLLSAVAVAMSSLGRELDAAQRTADMAERQAADRALLLREMQHRIKNHIARIHAIARQSLRGAADLAEFERIFGGRLAAMAKAQDALGSSGCQQADLRTLLSGELSQVLDGAAVEAALTGPAVRLNSREAQAIGLVAHELVTNAVKYTPGQGVDLATHDLAVGWRIVEQSGKPWLHLDWTEPRAMTAATPADSRPHGFGTQLIEALIEGDLGGRFSRAFTDAGMRVTLSFPLSKA